MRNALQRWRTPLEALWSRSGFSVPLTGQVIVGICAVSLVFLAGADSASTAGYERFFVEAGYDSEARESVRAEQLFSSRHARILVDSSYWSSLGEERKAQERVALAALITEFDGRIYPLTRELLGAEWNPGVDRDPRIVLLLTPMIEGTFGYARPFIDETRAEGSNEAEIVYVNARTLSSPRTKAELAASFAELIAYHERVIASGVPEAPWVLAMAASYAPTYLGYDTPFADSKLANEAQVFLSSPSNSFLDWDGGKDDRASASLFAHFIAGRYGAPFFQHLMRASQPGEQALTLALRLGSARETFDSALSSWAIANSMNGETADGSVYAYTHPSLGFSRVRVVPEYRAPIGEGGASVSRFALGPASAQWVRYTPRLLGSNGLNSLFLKIEGFDGADTNLSYIETAIDGTSRVQTLRLRDGVGEARVDLFGTYILSVVIVPTNTGSTQTTLQVEAYSRESDRTSAEGALPDGTLVRGNGSDNVFVIQGESRRWIQSPEIFTMYGHMRWEDVRQVPTSTLAWYRESFLVRAEGDKKVYETTPSGAKHWLNMSAGAFRQSGRQWSDVFVINEKELLWYADAQER